MDFELFFTLTITAGLTIVGWFMAHRLSVGRDAERQRKERRVEYLSGAYRRLAAGVYRGSLFEAMEEVQSALADIYLFGSEEQIKKAESFIQLVGRDKQVEIDDLLVTLCSDLREELGLSALDREKLWWIIRDNGANNSSNPTDSSAHASESAG